jgi:MFS family permease
MPKNGYRWIILVLSYFCMLVFAFTLQSLPPILPLIIKELGLSHAQAGLLMSLFALPAIFLAILAGMFLDRFGAYRTGFISLGLVIAGNSILALSGTFLFAGLGRVVSGIGAVTLAVVSAQFTSQWFRGREIGAAMGIFNTAMPTGTIVSFMVFGRLAEGLGWRTPISLSAIIGAVVLVAFLILYRPLPDTAQGKGPEKDKKQAGPFSTLLSVGLSMWLVGFCWMWFNASVISFSTFAPDFFVSRGYSIASAGSLASLLMWVSLILSPVVGRLVDKFGNNDLFIASGGAIIAVIIYMISGSRDFLLPMIVLAIGVAVVPTPIYSFTSKIMRPENSGLGFGILSTVSSAGMVFGPYLTGVIKDRTGSYELSFTFLSILALLVTLTAVALRIKTVRD